MDSLDSSIATPTDKHKTNTYDTDKHHSKLPKMIEIITQSKKKLILTY